MRNMKKIPSENCTVEIASSRVMRSRKKAAENVVVIEKKVSDLITSSTRKQKVCTLLKKGVNHVALSELNTRHDLIHDKASNQSLVDDAIQGAYVDSKSINDGTVQVSETMFSPAFHKSKIAGGENGNGVDFVKFFRDGDENVHDIAIEYSEAGIQSCHVFNNTAENIYGEQQSYSEDAMDLMNSTCLGNMEVDTNTMVPFVNPDLGGANLSCEVSAIYLAMKNSKLECVDELVQDSISMEECVEDDDDDIECFEEFDPYLFIKTLPSLSSVVPTFRPTLLPKQTRSCHPTTLVLDLDETLVHSTLEPCDDADFTFPVNFNMKEHIISVRCRPHLKDFLEKAASLFEIIIFTASQSIYAEKLLNVLDPKRKYFRHRIYRDSCVYVEGNYLKDLSVLGRDLARVMIIDNSPQAFGFQVNNGIPIESWFDDRSDQELLQLLPFLEILAGVEDVRPLITKKFNLQEKIDASVCPLKKLPHATGIAV